MKTIWIINQYASTPATGMGGRHHNLARTLGKLGYRVYLIGAQWHHLLSVPQTGPFGPDIEPQEDYTFVRIPTLKYAHAHDKKRFLSWLAFRWRIKQLARILPEKPDAILYSSPSLLAAPAAAALARKFGARFAFEVRDIWPLTLVEVGNISERHPAIRYMQHVEDQAYKDADVVISNLPNAVDHMVARGMARDKFHWIPNGISLAEISDPLPLNEITQSALPKGKFIVGYAGTIGEANALETMVGAAEILKDHPNIAFVITGKGRSKQMLAELISQKGLTNIHLLDAIPKQEIPSLLSHFDACYIGLTHDALFRFGVSPNKLFDYMAASRPIIYGIDSGAYRPVEETGAGLQIAPQDPDALAQAALSMANMSQAKRQKMGQNGRDAVVQRHDYTALAHRLAEALLPNDNAG